jgi:hypothetical protein
MVAATEKRVHWLSRRQAREIGMASTSATEREVPSADDLFDLAERIANGSADPDATYEGFLRGLEMGLTCNTLDPVVSKAIGYRLADRLPEQHDVVRDDARVIVDPTRKSVRTAPRPLIADGADYPTEWTLDPG